MSVGMGSSKFRGAGTSVSQNDGLSRLPDELTEEFSRDERAFNRFLELPPSHQREYVQWILDARRDDTRRRRAAQTVVRLLER